MSSRDSATAKGRGCIILIALIWFVCSQIAKWVSHNRETVNHGIEVAKKVGVLIAVAVVVVFILKRIFAYRRAIRHSEQNYLSVVLHNHDFDGLMRRTKVLSENARKVLPEIEKGQAELERSLRDLRNERC